MSDTLEDEEVDEEIVSPADSYDTQWTGLSFCFDLARRRVWSKMSVSINDCVWDILRISEDEFAEVIRDEDGRD